MMLYVYSYLIQKRKPLRLVILRPFHVIFCQLNKHLSQNLVAKSHFEVLNKKSCFGCLKRIYLRFKDAAVFYNHSSKVIKVGQSWPSYSNGHTQGHTSFGIFEQGSAIPAVCTDSSQ